MAYFIRDDRMTPQEAAQRNHGKPERYQVKPEHVSPKLTSFRDSEGKYVFIHSAPTVLHDACVHSNIPGVTHDENIADPHERLNASFAARDEFAALFGPGQSLCWGPVWTVNPDTAPDCYFCGAPVVGKC
jgi:hypothetical protein